MGTLGVFDFVTLDGFFAGPRGEIDWFKGIPKDVAFEAYTHGQSKSGSTLMFGRTTYEMMKSYWPTPEAIKSDPQMADVMNNNPKIVFSRTLTRLDWKNIKLLREIGRDAILDLKKKSDITVLGSGTIVQQLANLGLVDEYHLVVVPLVLGSGKRLFEGVKRANLELRDARPFANGVVVLKYGPGA